MLESLGAEFTVYPNRGLSAPDFPAAWPYPAGVYDVPIKLPERYRLIIATTSDGELVHAALVEPGGDIKLATDDLQCRLYRRCADEETGQAQAVRL
jgi:hypothetical protein